MQNIFYPLEQLYKFLYLSVYDITGNYGIALILLSLFIYIILFPFNQKAQQIQNAEREIQSIIAPQIEEIKRQFHGKEQYERIQRLYHRYAYHPIYAIRSAAGIVLQIPFFVAARSMLYALPDIKGVQWGIIQDLGKPDQLLAGINLLPFLMTFVTVLYAFVMPKLSKKEITQTVIIGFIFLIILYPAPSALLIFWTWNLLWSLLHCLLFDRLQWFNGYVERIGDFISKNELAFHIIFALALTVGLLVPLEVYIKNARQLWISLKDIFNYFVLDTAKCFVFLSLAYFIVWVKKIRFLYLSVLLGVLCGIFLQSYVIGIDYGLFDGHEITWEKYTAEGLLNTVIWLFCLGETFAVFKRFKFDLEKLKKYVKPATFGIVVIQCIALMFALKNNPLPDTSFRSNDSINVLTTKDMFTISSKDNIIVFVLDAFDAKIFEEIMVKDPDIVKDLNGFTFYPDTVSVYGNTDYSLPQILTGKVYLNDRSYSEYIAEAWKGTSYYNNLLDNNYDVSIYTAGKFISKTAPISNLVIEKTVLDDESMRSFNNLVKFRMVPHFAKKSFYDYDPNAWTRQLANSNVQAYHENDRLFYDTLKKGLTYQDEKNSFRFYHLTGAHFPFILDRNLEPVSNNIKGTQYEQSVGAMKIVIEYIRQMKDKNVFDNSTIIIMADHGDHNTVGSRPLLCVKQPNDHSSMKVSRVSMSFVDFMPMLIQRFQNIENNKAPFRYFYYVTKEDDFIEYRIKGNAKNLHSWTENNVLKDYRSQDCLYVIGTTIDFSIHGDSKRFKKNGWNRAESLGTWTLSTDADLIFKISGYKKQDLKLSFVALAYLADLPSREVILYANNERITALTFDNKYPLIEVLIPSSIMSDNTLNLHFTINHSGVSVKYENRDLGLFVQQMKIEAVE